MIRIPRFTRLAAVFVLMVSAFAVGMSPAGSEPAATGSATSTGDGTATLTYSGVGDLEVYIIDGASPCPDTGLAPATGVLATIGVDSVAPASPITVTTATQVGPAPAHALGTGSFNFCMYDASAEYTWLNTTGGTIGIFDPATASMVDNGNGTLTLTWDANGDFSQFVYFFLFSGLTTCPEEPTSEVFSLTGFGMQSNSDGFGAPLPASPAIIGVGTQAIILPWVPVDMMTPPSQGPITAGQYLACAYTASNGDVALASSFAMGVGIVPEPVVPAFTG
jgi:hypothetical protein